MSFGWSASDIYSLFVLCTTVVENCTDGLRSASSQVNFLRREVEEFGVVLRQLQSHLSETRDLSFLDLRDVKYTLEDCSRYLARYQPLQVPDDDSPEFSNGKQEEKPARRNSPYKAAIFKMKWVTFGGDKELSVLQTRLSQHRQSISLYIQILNRQRTFETNRTLDKRLRDVEIKMEEFYQGNRRHSDTTNDASMDSSSTVTAQDAYNYQSMLYNVSQQRILAMVESQGAENDVQVQEWKWVYDQLDQCQRRVLNFIQRKVNRTVQQGREGLVQYDRPEVPPRNTILNTPAFKPPTRTGTCDSGIGESLPSVAEEDDRWDEVDPLAGGPTSHNVPLTPFAPPNSINPRQYDLGINCPGFTSPRSPVDSISALSGPDPFFCPRTASIASLETPNSATCLHWQNVQLRGWLKMAWTGQTPPIACSLEAGYGANGQVSAIRATRAATKTPISILSLLTGERRPIPHTEPFGGRDHPEDGIQAYFIDPPPMEPSMNNPTYIFEDPDDHREFESLVYGQRLVLSIKVKKIFSSNKPEADGQLIRVWESLDSNCTRQLLYYASGRWKPGYVTVFADDVTPNFKLPKKGEELELKLQGRPGAQSIRIKFNCRYDLETFSATFLGKLEPSGACSQVEL